MLRKLSITLATAAAMAAGTVPAAAGTVSESIRTVDATESVVTFYVRNDFAKEVTVELVFSDGRRLELGAVTARQGHMFQVEASVLAGNQSVRLRVESTPDTRSDLSRPLLGDDTVLSRAFTPSAEAYVELRVAPDLGNSRAWINNG